jgi:hypothetical protein
MTGIRVFQQLRGRTPGAEEGVGRPSIISLYKAETENDYPALRQYLPSMRPGRISLPLWEILLRTWAICARDRNSMGELRDSYNALPESDQKVVPPPGSPPAPGSETVSRREVVNPKNKGKSKANNAPPLKTRKPVPKKEILDKSYEDLKTKRAFEKRGTDYSDMTQTYGQTPGVGFVVPVETETVLGPTQLAASSVEAGPSAHRQERGLTRMRTRMDLNAAVRKGRAEEVKMVAVDDSRQGRGKGRQTFFIDKLCSPLL